MIRQARFNSVKLYGNVYVFINACLFVMPLIITTCLYRADGKTRHMRAPPEREPLVRLRAGVFCGRGLSGRPEVLLNRVRLRVFSPVLLLARTEPAICAQDDLPQNVVFLPDLICSDEQRKTKFFCLDPTFSV